MWLILALLAPGIYAIANVIDNFLSERKFKNPISLVFYSSVLNLLFIPVIYLLSGIERPPEGTLLLLLGLGLVNIACLYPYYKGLQHDDTSTTISFFALARVFIPVLAYFIVGEVLTVQQYVGIALIISSSVLLGFKRHKKGTVFSKAFWYIALSAFIVSFEGILFKLLFDRGVTVGTALSGQLFLAFLVALSLLFFSRSRRTIFNDVGVFRRAMPLFFVEEFFTFLAVLVEAYAISLAPVSLVKGLVITPIYVLLYAKILGPFYPHWFKEELHLGRTWKKIALFLLITAGAILIVA